jgi:hypothetical protein
MLYYKGKRTFDSSSNDSGDKGDVEDALRLEGQINPKILQERAEKVDGWVRTMQRMANGDYDDERSILSEEEVENFIDKLDPFASDPDSQPEAAVTPEEDNPPYNSDDDLLCDWVVKAMRSAWMESDRHQGGEDVQISNNLLLILMISSSCDKWLIP